MRKAAISMLILLAACSGGGAPLVAPTSTAVGPVEFRALSEQQSAAYCMDAPQFAVAVDEQSWIDVFDMHTQCQPGDGEVSLPPVDFDLEIAVAGWWKVEPCLGYGIATKSIERTAQGVVVSAVSTEPPQGTACAQALGQLESFLAIPRSELVTGDETFHFVLDGSVVGVARASDL